MESGGLRESEQSIRVVDVATPSETLSGSVIAASLEGMRPLMIETQALDLRLSVYGTPQRSATGLTSVDWPCFWQYWKSGWPAHWSQRRFSQHSRGIRVTDPAIDLAIFTALISSLNNIGIGRNVCFAAEIGLTGEIRGESHRTTHPGSRPPWFWYDIHSAVQHEKCKKRGWALMWERYPEWRIYCTRCLGSFVWRLATSDMRQATWDLRGGDMGWGDMRLCFSTRVTCPGDEDMRHGLCDWRHEDGATLDMRRATWDGVARVLKFCRTEVALSAAYCLRQPRIAKRALPEPRIE